MIDIHALRRDHPLPNIVGATVKLKRAGNEFKGCCPFHGEKSPSFTIFASGKRFYCFGCGASGDVLDFVRRAHGVSLRRAADMLSGGSMPSVEVTMLSSDGKPDRVEEAQAIWRSAQPITGTPAETYLRFRGLHLPLPASLRFTHLRYGRHGPKRPVLVAAIASADNKLIGIQRTYLNSNGTGKADISKPKLSLGRVVGGAIRLAPCAKSMFVCEGLEDGLTLQQELGQATWVAAGASMLPAMQFPMEVSAIAIGGDNDEAGRMSADKACEAFTGIGIAARVFFPGLGKDFNGELMRRTKT